jgi:hypothetical protein
MAEGYCLAAVPSTPQMKIEVKHWNHVTKIGASNFEEKMIL